MAIAVALVATSLSSRIRVAVSALYTMAAASSPAFPSPVPGSTATAGWIHGTGDTYRVIEESAARPLVRVYQEAARAVQGHHGYVQGS